MNNIEIKQITKIDDDTLDTITKWMYNWWGKEDWYVFEELKCFMKLIEKILEYKAYIN